MQQGIAVVQGARCVVRGARAMLPSLRVRRVGLWVDELALPRPLSLSLSDRLGREPSFASFGARSGALTGLLAGSGRVSGRGFRCFCVRRVLFERRCFCPSPVAALGEAQTLADLRSVLARVVSPRVSQHPSPRHLRRPGPVRVQGPASNHRSFEAATHSPLY